MSISLVTSLSKYNRAGACSRTPTIVINYCWNNRFSLSIRPVRNRPWKKTKQTAVVRRQGFSFDPVTRDQSVAFPSDGTPAYGFFCQRINTVIRIHECHRGLHAVRTVRFIGRGAIREHKTQHLWRSLNAGQQTCLVGVSAETCAFRKSSKNIINVVQGPWGGTRCFRRDRIYNSPKANPLKSF